MPCSPDMTGAASDAHAEPPDAAAWLRLPPGQRNWALFLDVDGTLVGPSEPPEAARIAPQLHPVFRTLMAATDGAVALVSGRAISSLDQVFAPFVLPAAGQHGMERRTSRGELIQEPVDRTILDALIAHLTRYVATRPGLEIDIKNISVGLDYRLAPAYAAEAADFFQDLIDREAPGFHVQRGKTISEARLLSATKGRAIEAFMAESPFCNRVPVFLGDDLPDEDGFVTTNRLGGVSVRVGADPVTTAAQWRIDSIAEVHDWLKNLAATIGDKAQPAP
ncbi:MAG: trehalose-phosphatase [Azospirillaceae bacterium]|nr:trehalose-phosphatase [Azospirillaceae bacterium]